MLSERTTRKLEALSKVSLSGKKAKDLSRLMNHEDLWMQAYLNIQGNTGAITAGVTNDTIDGFSVDKVSNLTALLRENRYFPQPVKRIENQGYFEVHHVRKLKNVKGKTFIERQQIALHRKTIVLCVECHHRRHAGKYFPGMNTKKD